ncbi:MAG: hypothetical protein J0M11_03680 [Anaerolineae bacterium]|nr:hypothetical protein [Anaerolineae bacterium]
MKKLIQQNIYIGVLTAVITAALVYVAILKFLPAMDFDIKGYLSRPITEMKVGELLAWIYFFTAIFSSRK